MPVSDSGSYLNLAQLSKSDFLYLQDKKAPGIGAITKLTNMWMEIKETSPAFVQVCGRWEAGMAPALLSSWQSHL